MTTQAELENGELGAQLIHNGMNTWASTAFFEGKLLSIEEEVRRLHEAIMALGGTRRTNLPRRLAAVQDEVILKVPVDLDFQFSISSPLTDFHHVNLLEAPECVEPGQFPTTPASVAPQRKVHAMVAQRGFPVFPLDCFLGAAIVNQKVWAFTGTRLIKETPPKPPRPDPPKQRHHATTVPPRTAQPAKVAFPSLVGVNQLRSVPLTDAFFVKAESQIVDDALAVVEDTSVTGKKLLVKCPNIRKNVNLTDKLVTPVFLHPIPDSETPLPDDFAFTDIPGATPDQLRCLCESKRIVIKEVTIPSTKELDDPANFSSWAGTENLAGVEINAETNEVFSPNLLIVEKEQLILYMRSSCIQNVFCPELAAECDPRFIAPFETLIEHDGGQDERTIAERTREVHRAVDRALRDPDRPTREVLKQRPARLASFRGDE